MIALVLAFGVSRATEAQAPREIPPGAGSGEAERQREEIAGIVEKFHAGQHEAVIERVEEFAARYPLTGENVGVRFYQAESRYRLGQVDAAIQTYQAAIPIIERLNNVQQRRYANVFFKLGRLYREQGRYEAAADRVEAGLRLEPQNTYYQILLGELFREQGHPDRALKHFGDLLVSTVPSNEERAVLSIKVDRLRSGGASASSRPVDMSTAPFHPSFSFGLLALNDVPSEVSLRDVCVLLESKWLVRCEVLPTASIDEGKILDIGRRQYDGEKVLGELNRQYPGPTRPHRFLVAITGRDLFGPGTNYAFSWQRRHDDGGIGVISAYRFVTGLEEFYERRIMATRGLGIQALSTTGWMLGFTRPPKPECPMAYPHEFREFQNKKSALCESTIEQRDALLKRKGGSPAPFGAARSAEVDRVYRAYFFE